MNGFIQAISKEQDGRPGPKFHDILVATEKDDFRKPAAGMWHWLIARHEARGSTVNSNVSFFVGDAAGRKGDHSDSDKKMAEAAGLVFFNEKDFFSSGQLPSLPAPQAVLSEKEDSESDIVDLTSGKSD